MRGLVTLHTKQWQLLAPRLPLSAKRSELWGPWIGFRDENAMESRECPFGEGSDALRIWRQCGGPARLRPHSPSIVSRLEMGEERGFSRGVVHHQSWEDAAGVRSARRVQFLPSGDQAGTRFGTADG